MTTVVSSSSSPPVDTYVTIPLASQELTDGTNKSVRIFLDEFPTDHNDLIDVLRSEFAPLKVWRIISAQYFRLGNSVACKAILQDIIDALSMEEVLNSYKKSADFTSDVSDVYLAQAAVELMTLFRLTTNISSDIQSTEPFKEAARRADSFLTQSERMGGSMDSLLLLKGFLALLQGSFSSASESFFMLRNRARSTTTTQTTSTISKRRYLFGSNIGMALIAYHQRNFSTALNHLAEAIKVNPNADASIRTAYAVCAYCDGQYDRSRMALERSIAMDPSDANQLVLLALLDLVEANTNREHRVRLRRNAYEYLRLAVEIDPNHGPALNLLAIHNFHTWCVVPVAHVIVPEGMEASPLRQFRMLEPNRVELVIKKENTRLLHKGNQIRFPFGEDVKHLVLTADVNEPVTEEDKALFDAGYVKLDMSFTPSLTTDAFEQLATMSTDENSASLFDKVEVRDFQSVLIDAQKVIQSSNHSYVRAESYYIMAKVVLGQSDMKSAFQLLKRANHEAQDFVLAAFGAAQLNYVSRNYEGALALFEAIHQKVPGDKDTCAYLALCRGLLKKEETPFEKLREVAPGFQFEAELWLSQASIRMGNPKSDPAHTLKCFTAAKDVLEAAKKTVPSSLLENLGVLHHKSGKYDKALQFVRSAMRAQRDLSGTKTALLSNEQPKELLMMPEFEGFFYSWSDRPMVYVEQDNLSRDRFRLIGLSGEDAGINLKTQLTEGQQVTVEDIIWVIESIDEDGSGFTAKPNFGSYLYSYPSGSSLALYTKEVWNTFREDTFATCFNYACILQSAGFSYPAEAIFKAAIAAHPSFQEAYVHLGHICIQLGKPRESLIWFKKAIDCKGEKNNNNDLDLYIADVHLAMGGWKEAKRLYEEHLSQTKNARTSVSLATCYFQAIDFLPPSADNKYMERGFKIMRDVLTSHPDNLYAANAIGMFCAKKGSLSSAREIFDRLRLSNIQSIDVDVNLAAVYISEGRYIDAERLYMAAYRRMNRSMLSLGTLTVLQLLELVAYTQFHSGRPEEARRTLSHVLHMNPASTRSWNNLYIVADAVAAKTIERRTKTIAETRCAFHVIQFGLKALRALKRTDEHFGSGVVFRHVKDSVLSHREISAKSKLKKLSDQLEIMLEEEKRIVDERREVEKSHAERVAAMESQRIAAIAAEEEKKRNAQQAAQEKERRLLELQQQWIVPTNDRHGPTDHFSGDDEEEDTSTRKRPGKSSTTKSKRAKTHHSDDEDLFGPETSQPPSDGDMDEIFGSDNESPATVETPAASAPPTNDDEEEDLFGAESD